MTHSPAHHAARLYQLNHRQQLPYFTSLSPFLQTQTLLLLSDSAKQSLLNSLPDLHLGRLISRLPEDEAVDVLQLLSKKRHGQILSQLDGLLKNKITTLLKFGPASSGGLMDLNFLEVTTATKIPDLAKLIHNHIRLHKQAPTVILKSAVSAKILGYIPYRQLIISPPSTSLKSIVSRLPLISSRLHQSRLLKKAHHLSADTLGVLDDSNHLIGVVHLHDLLKAADKDAQTRLYAFAGVNPSEDINDSVSSKVKHRLKWLIINLFTAFLASWVVSFFEPTIRNLAILAVFMPLVAGQGSNAAMQTLAVTIRGLALNQLNFVDSLHIIRKELLSGLLNGLVIAAAAIPIAFFFKAPLSIGLILAVALLANLLVAALFASSIPFVLKRLNIDPAVASSVFVTTATDVFGFLVLLGLATKFLL